MKRKIAPTRIDQSIFNRLKKREQEYILLLYQKKFTKSQIMDKLLIDNVRTFERLQAKISGIVKRHFVAKGK